MKSIPIIKSNNKKGLQIFIYQSSTGRIYNIWDMAGNPQYRGQNPTINYDGTDLFLIVERDEHGFTRSGMTVNQWEEDIRSRCPSANIHVLSCPSMISTFFV